MEDTKKSEIIDEIEKIPEQLPKVELPEMVKTANAVQARAYLLQRKNKRKEIIVPVPEWGMEVLIVALSGTARSEYFIFNNYIASVYQGKPDFFKRLWFEQVRISCLHPETREQILQEADIDEFMGDNDGFVIETLASIVREVSGLNAGALEDAKKKLLTSASDFGTTSSPNGLAAKA